MVTRSKGFSVLAAICSDSGALCAVFSRRPRRPAGHAHPRAASLRSCRCMWCRQALTGAADPAACLRMEALRWGPQMISVLLCYRWTESVVAMCAGFGGASRTKMECWVADECLLSALLGSTEVVRTRDRGLACSSGGVWRLTGRKAQLPVGEWCPAGARAVCDCWWQVGSAGRSVPAGSW